MFGLKISTREQKGDRQHVSRSSLSAGAMALAATLVIGMTVSVPVAAQLVNGNFENNPQNGAPLVTNGNYVDPGTNSWKVTAGTVNVGTAPAGSPCQIIGSNIHCVDLNGDKPGR